MWLFIAARTKQGWRRRQISNLSSRGSPLGHVVVRVHDGNLDRSVVASVAVVVIGGLQGQPKLHSAKQERREKKTSSDGTRGKSEEQRGGKPFAASAAAITAGQSNSPNVLSLRTQKYITAQTSSLAGHETRQGRLTSQNDGRACPLASTCCRRR